MQALKFISTASPTSSSSSVREDQIESDFIGKVQHLKYDYRRDITDHATLEQNFREKFEALNRVLLTDSEFARLLDGIVTPDVFTADEHLLPIYQFVFVVDCKEPFLSQFSYLTHFWEQLNANAKQPASNTRPVERRLRRGRRV